MALSDLYGWNVYASAAPGTSCGAGGEEPQTACGAGEGKPQAACGTACGAGDK